MEYNPFSDGGNELCFRNELAFRNNTQGFRNGGNNIIKLETTGIAVVNGILQITISSTHTYVNYRYYLLLALAALPAITGTEPVVIFDGANTYPLFDSDAQPVVSGVLRGQKSFLLRFGAGGVYYNGSMPPHFTVYRGLEHMEYSSNPALQGCR